MTNFEKALVGVVTALLLAVVGIRYGRSRMVAGPPPGPVAKAMNLEVTVRGGDFTLTIRNADTVYYVGCRAIIDRDYQSPLFNLGVRIVPEWVVREPLRDAEARYEHEGASVKYLQALTQVAEGARKRVFLVSHKPEVRIHLSDFTRGERRYPWQERHPRQVEVVCARYRVLPQEASSPARVWWDRLRLPEASIPGEVWFDHLSVPDEFIRAFFDTANQDPRWPWGDSARWVGGPF